MASKQEIVETLTLLAAKAFENGETALGNDLNAVIAAHGGAAIATPDGHLEPAGPANAPTVPVEEQTSEQSSAEGAELAPAPAAAVPEMVERAPRGAARGELDDALGELDDDLAAEMAAMIADTFGPGARADLDHDADADHGLAALAAQINGVGEDAVRAATPRSLTLAVTGPQPADAALALEIANGVVPSIIEVIGEVTIGDVVVGEATTVALNLPETNDGTALAAMAGALGLAVFEAHWPVGDVTYTVTALAAEVADIDLARDLGMAAPEDFELPAVPAGQHPINGMLQIAEEAYGFRPEAASLRVTYRRAGADHEIRPELTRDQVARIVEHPISQDGLRRFGNLALVDIADGATADAKIASFGILDGGEIDPAVLTLGAAAYRGTFDFGGDIGQITANAETVLVDAHVEV